MAQNNTLYLTEAVYISGSPMTENSRNSFFSGGGGYGSGGWGLSEGRPRGTGGSGRFNEQDISARRVLAETVSAMNQTSATTYAPLLQNLPEAVSAEAAAAKAAATTPQMTPAERLNAERQALSNLIDSKRQAYLNLTVQANAYYGSSPIYKLGDSFYTRIFEGAITANQAIFEILWTSLEAAYNQDLLAESISLLSAQLPLLAEQQADQGLTQPVQQWPQALEGRNAAIRQEQRICFECLPAYLQQEVIDSTPDTSSFAPVQALATYIASLNALIAQKRQQIVPYASSNPSIVGPLSKHRMEALRSLVQEQLNKRAGPRWLDYHQALMLGESVRHMEMQVAAFTALQIRAVQVEVLLAQHQAEEAARKDRERAEEQARIEAQALAEAARKQISYASIGNLAVAAPFVAPLGGGAFNIPQTAYAALQAAIRAAVQVLSSAAAVGSGVASSAFAVGVGALLWPSSLGNSERQFVSSVPLGDLLLPEATDLAAIAAAGGHVQLPYSLLAQTDVEQTRLIVASTANVPEIGTVAVRAAVYDAQRNVYSIALENPERILTWTPVTAPGSESAGASPLPEHQLPLPIYDGVTLAPVEVQAAPDPPLDFIDLESIIVVFPAGSGLENIFVVFNKPGDWSYHTPPKALAAFPCARQIKGKTYKGQSKKIRKRWIDVDGSLLEWDSQHGRVEKYDKRGTHMGEFDPTTGAQTKPAKPGRKIDP